MLSRSILITGCSRGLGLEMVRQLVKSDNPPETVIATCRNLSAAKELQALAAEHKVIKIIQFDVTDYDDLPRVAQEVKESVGPMGLSLLVNNAGIIERIPDQMFGMPLTDLTPEIMNNVLDTNVTAPLMLVKELMPLLQDASKNGGLVGVKRAAVINISSILGSMGEFTGNPDIYAYRTSKAALNMMTKALAMEFGADGMLFVGLHPGWVQTNIGTLAGNLTPQESIGHIFNLLPTLTEKHNGLFLSLDGNVLKW